MCARMCVSTLGNLGGYPFLILDMEFLDTWKNFKGYFSLKKALCSKGEYNWKRTRQELLMIHSASPQSWPAVIFVLFWKVGTYGHSYTRTDNMCGNSDHCLLWLWSASGINKVRMVFSEMRIKPEVLALIIRFFQFYSFTIHFFTG